jgi:hypothetical protein
MKQHDPLVLRPPGPDEEVGKQQHQGVPLLGPGIPGDELQRLRRGERRSVRSAPATTSWFAVAVPFERRARVMLAEGGKTVWIALYRCSSWSHSGQRSSVIVAWSPVSTGSASRANEALASVISYSWCVTWPSRPNAHSVCGSRY